MPDAVIIGTIAPKMTLGVGTFVAENPRIAVIRKASRSREIFRGGYAASCRLYKRTADGRAVDMIGWGADIISESEKSFSSGLSF